MVLSFSTLFFKGRHRRRYQMGALQGKVSGRTLAETSEQALAILGVGANPLFLTPLRLRPSALERLSVGLPTLSSLFQPFLASFLCPKPP